MNRSRHSEESPVMYQGNLPRLSPRLNPAHYFNLGNIPVEDPPATSNYVAYDFPKGTYQRDVRDIFDHPTVEHLELHLNTRDLTKKALFFEARPGLVFPNITFRGRNITVIEKYEKRYVEELYYAIPAYFREKYFAGTEKNVILQTDPGRYRPKKAGPSKKYSSLKKSYKTRKEGKRDSIKRITPIMRKTRVIPKPEQNPAAGLKERMKNDALKERLKKIYLAKMDQYKTVSIQINNIECQIVNLKQRQNRLEQEKIKKNQEMLEAELNYRRAFIN